MPFKTEEMASDRTEHRTQMLDKICNHIEMMDKIDV